MMTTSVYVHKDDKFIQGHRPGTLDIDRVAIYFMQTDPVPQLEQLRDECQRQIGVILADRKLPEPMVAAAAPTYQDGRTDSEPELQPITQSVHLPMQMEPESDIAF